MRNIELPAEDAFGGVVDELEDLAHNTRECIREIASIGGKILDEMDADPTYPRDADVGLHSADSSWLHDYRRTRRVSPSPQRHHRRGLPGKSALHVVGAYTESRVMSLDGESPRAFHAVFNPLLERRRLGPRVLGLELASSGKLLVHHPGISDEGRAYRGTGQPLVDLEKWRAAHGHEKAEKLRVSWADQYRHELAIAYVVSTGLVRSFGIELDVEGTQEMYAKWSEAMGADVPGNTLNDEMVRTGTSGLIHEPRHPGNHFARFRQ